MAGVGGHLLKALKNISVHLFATVCFSGLLCAQTAAPTVKTTQGAATGKWIRDGKEEAFLGLPYAAPPVGDLRWKAPELPAKWTGVRDATKFGNRCEQWHVWDDYIFTDPGPSEDCLYLNVYAPASAKQGNNLPVMVWIHGGRFLARAGSEPRYTNPALVAKGVIVVTLNYRLNIFGFLASEDLAKEQGGHAGNYGLMDQVAALRWVKSNIAAFGGDPNNVTIFGESAGSFAVSALTVAPSARGLFNKVIGESGAFFGGAFPMTTSSERAKRDQAFVNSLSAQSLKDLRAMPAEKILEAVHKQRGIQFSPVVDGAFLPESPVAGALTAHHAKRCRGVVFTSVPYSPESFALPSLLPLIDRKVYPADQYPDGQWDYYRFYLTHFDQTVRLRCGLPGHSLGDLSEWKSRVHRQGLQVCPHHAQRGLVRLGPSGAIDCARSRTLASG